MNLAYVVAEGGAAWLWYPLTRSIGLYLTGFLSSRFREKNSKNAAKTQ
jgi:hypothetical protein